MKMPSFNLAAATDVLLRHGEKIVAAIVGLGGLILVWGGIDAMRSLAVTDAQTPKAVSQAATQARDHIGREAQPPADLLPPRKPLADALDVWRTPLVPWKSGTAPGLTIAATPSLPVLDSPLFEELKKRGQPDVLPLEDVRAVAGVALLPVPEPAAGGAQPRRGQRGGEAAEREPPPEMTDVMGRPVERGLVVPYVIVTGLIPAAKQHAEYLARFQGCGFRDPRRDAPLWSDYEIDRATVGRDGQETWTKIDLVAAAKQAAAWGPLSDTGVPPEFQLASDEDLRSMKTTPLGFVSSLPRRIDGTWELADLHPWVVERLLEALAAAGRELEPGVGEQVEPGFGAAVPGFDTPPEGAVEAAQPEGMQQLEQRPEYRLFRFIDTAVTPGETYRYRVRLKVWNPNFDQNPERMRPHVADPKLALEQKLSSPNSEPASATVPPPTRVLVDTLRRDTIKDMRLKPGTLELLVLGAGAETGSIALRGFVGDPGAVIDVDEKFNSKTQRDRARGEKLVTGRVLVDARGRQLDRRDGPADREKPPGAIPEPLDVLCIRPDGSYEMVSVVESGPLVARYRATLPPIRDPKPEDAKAGLGEQPLTDTPPPDPLARPGAKR